MKAKKLTLSNFRGFPQLDLELDDRVTVLAGVNGSGKSAILRAIATLLSHLLPKVSPSKEKPEPLNAGDVHAGKSALTISATFADEKRTLHAQVTRSIPDPSKARKLAHRRDQARFAIRETRKGSKEATDLLEEIRYLEELLKGDQDHFSFQIEDPAGNAATAGARADTAAPLAILYATSRYMGGMPPRFAQTKPFEPANAYPGALSGKEVSLAAFATWFRAARRGALGREGASDRLLDQVETVVTTILPGFSKPRLVDTKTPRFYVTKDGAEFELRQLSDGERGLLGLAFDLTRRLAIANPQAADPVATGRAIVLLDEVELHLHPGWQRKVLGRLARTFKNCQFIATTHSPQVIGQARTSSLRLLHQAPEGGFRVQTVSQSFGMDSNWVLQEIMDTPARDYETERKLATARDAIDDGHNRKARKLVQALEKDLGLFPDLQEMKSMLDRFELLQGK